MTPININEPDRFSYRRSLEEMNAKLEAELKLWKSRCDAAEDQLEAIFENIKEGRECYLDYRDKTRIWIARDVTRERTKETDDAKKAEWDAANGGGVYGTP